MFVREGIDKSVLAEQFEQQKAEMRDWIEGLEDLPVGALAITVAMMLMQQLEEQQKPLKYSLRQYSRRTLHILRLTDDPAEGLVLMKQLLENGDAALGQIFEELLERVGYQDGDDLPEEMLVVIENMESSAV
jgi:hypothetical protein